MSDFDDRQRVLGRSLGFGFSMYDGGATREERLPELADAKTFEAYAQLPKWHVEEAPSLVAGYKPRARRLLPFRPTGSDAEWEGRYEGPITWARLIDTEQAVGRILSLYAREIGVPDYGFAGETLYVRPQEFLAFCDRHRIPVPDELRQAVNKVALARNTVQPTEAAASDTGKLPNKLAWQRQTDALMETVNEALHKQAEKTEREYEAVRNDFLHRCTMTELHEELKRGGGASKGEEPADISRDQFRRYVSKTHGFKFASGNRVVGEPRRYLIALLEG